MVAADTSERPRKRILPSLDCGRLAMFVGLGFEISGYSVGRERGEKE
jgi:hypothetical protein